MKIILFLWITLFSFGNENIQEEKKMKEKEIIKEVVEDSSKIELEEIEQPLLEVIGIKELEKKMIYKELEKEILRLKAKVENYEAKFIINETRFMILDKVIQDKNQLVDEMDAKLDIIIKKRNVENSEEILKMKLLEKTVYRIVAIMVVVFLMLVILILGLGVAVERKNRKKIEEWKEIIELDKK